MVQYKRKPVKSEPTPGFLADDTEVWYIEETDEVFTDYEKYLAKRDFYQQKKFSCDATGHSSLTFFEARRSEVGQGTPSQSRGPQTLNLAQMEAREEVDSSLDRSLRQRVLRFVQFQCTPRMDDLVNLVFEHFRDRFQPGDRVIVEEQGRKHLGVVNNVADRNMKGGIYESEILDPEKAFIYYVGVDNQQGPDLIKIGSKEISRERKLYSKIILKLFLRDAVTREAKVGAPWMVKDEWAKRYDISAEEPRAGMKTAAMHIRKAADLPAHATNVVVAHNHPNAPPAPHQQIGLQEPSRPGFFGSFVTTQNLPPHLRAAGVNLDHENGPRPLMSSQPPFFIGPRINGHLPFSTQGPPFPFPNHMPPQIPPTTSGLNGLPISRPFQNSFMQYQAIAPTNTGPPPVATPPIPHPLPIKYPIEDLDVQPQNPIHRPTLKFFSDDVPLGCEPPEKKSGIRMSSMGALLTIWETLNVHDTVYHLDSFTFDDFVDAMRFSSEEVECELQIEAHCSVLKQIVSGQGKVVSSLRTIRAEDDESGSAENSTAEPTPEPVEEKPPTRVTRRSAMEAELKAAQAKRSPTPEAPKQTHRAADFLNEYDWIAQCKTREFRDGGWQSIMVGLVYTLSFEAHRKDVCDEILSQLVPVDEEPTAESVAGKYAFLDANLRIIALDMALGLSFQSSDFREQLTSAQEEMTKIRKTKIEHQRERKVLAEQLSELDNKRKILAPANLYDIPSEDAKENGGDVSMTGTEELPDDEGPESAPVPPKGSRNLRKANANKRKAEADAARKEKEKKRKAEAEKRRQQQEWENLLDEIEAKKQQIRDCEDMIDEQDDDLRETFVQRSRYLGQDRFMNRYYWFERNGMPFGGLPTSSTAEYGYANGRLWVQGPDKTEIQPLVTEPILSNDKEQFGVTVPERRDREEGKTQLTSSEQWGYYDDPKDIDALLSWFDERGIREKVLKRELLTYHVHITEYMEKLKEHLDDVEKTKAEGEENATGVSTRNRRYVDLDDPKDRCLAWTNSVMREEYGHSHYEQVKPKSTKKKAEARTKGVAVKVTKVSSRTRSGR